MGSKVTAKAVKRAVKEIKEKVPEVAAPVAPKVEEKPREEAKVQKAEAPTKAMRGCGCCPVELAPLPAGQKYFESPDGHVIVGEHDRGQVMDRRLNKGRGGWINPMR